MVTTGPHLLVVIHVINNQSACAYSDDCSNASQVRASILLYAFHDLSSHEGEIQIAGVSPTSEL